MQRDLNELLAANIISTEIADRIQDYYSNKKVSSTNRLFIVFGIFGAILISLGIILIIAHNWDNLTRLTKTLIAFFPLTIGQALCGYTIVKKLENSTWRESCSAFVFFSVGATISLVSQIYNIPGNLSSFLMLWMFLSLPLIYIMNSSITSLLYIIGITYYACETSYISYPDSQSYVYWLLLVLCLPHYYLLLKNKLESNFTTFHSYLVSISVVITLGTIAANTVELMYIAYFSLFGLFICIGDFYVFKNQKLLNNSYTIIGTLGTIVLLLMLSFDWFWEDLRLENFQFSQIIYSPEFYASIILTLLTGAFLYKQHKFKVLADVKLISWIFILFIVTFIIGLSSPLSVLLINLLVFAIGILTIRNGAKQDQLGVLNFGLLIITALIGCRFFDTELSFILRGILFISVGSGFFMTNYLMLKKRKTNE
jgi:uncharacterized membrane protein